ncbi:hypothetical protein PHJA_002790200 [Phtheirospermum japonicum]|uniref:Uncharacterized protein n=1 Tax=Phtheirospermum japonicum TaxID=374723 RepID=A0A830DKL7_9LAMI|nr:hypothetical protein PHJA_002790200 [Phtheirospermum japonicum]
MQKLFFEFLKYFDRRDALIRLNGEMEANSQSNVPETKIKLSGHARIAKHSLILRLIIPVLVVITLLILGEKLRENLRVYTRAAPWTHPTLEKYPNTGIVVVPRIPLILDALQLLMLLMMTDNAPII